MVKKHLKKCSTFLAIRIMQMKTTLRFHFSKTGRMAKINTQVTAHAGEDVEEGEHSRGGRGALTWRKGNTPPLLVRV